jgi:hypothetical protein
MNMLIDRHAWRIAGAALLLVAGAASTASAQLDPLLFIKRVPPNVVVMVDTSLRMQEDSDGYYYDPNFYLVASDPAVATALGVPVGTVSYRRRYKNLQYESVQDTNTKFAADAIVTDPAVYNPSDSSTFGAQADKDWLLPTRLEIAKRGIIQAVQANGSSAYRWGLMKLRQNTPAWRNYGSCDKPVRMTDAAYSAFTDVSPCNVNSGGKFGIYTPSVAGAGFDLTSGGNPLLVATGASTAASVVARLNRYPNDLNGLIPASAGAAGYQDRPLKFALDDAKTEVLAAIGRDSAAMRTCRNNIVVLITSGKNAGSATYLGSNNVLTVATSFKSVSGSGVSNRRVPIYVIGIFPPAADETELQAIADNSGGRYFRVSTHEEVTRAINAAVQAGFSRQPDFDAGKESEFTGVSPIVGTVNLKGAAGADGVEMENTEIVTPPLGGVTVVPQRSNVLVSAGFSLPGFEGRLRAFRVYKPEEDSSKPSGWAFINDGTKLWPDLDSRPELAGLARTHADPTRRNIYTAIPNGSGGVDVVSFEEANASTLTTHLGDLGNLTPETLIAYVRELPIGAIVGSTPALMDAPSLDPPPDSDYGRPDGSDTFAGQHKDRRSMLFFGANDGMIHAVDARTGYEVWAFIPYNLLPKLKVLYDGQPVDQFDYFVDSSPKVAEVKIDTGLEHEWRSLLIIGQGPGGTFYQAFDVTEAGMGVAPDRGSLLDVEALMATFDTPNETIQFKWAFPNYNSFDPAIEEIIPVTDATPGGVVRIYGDLNSTATLAERTVGYTWSDPAVGPLNDQRTVNVVMTGSGYMPLQVQTDTDLNRGSTRAGSTFYLIDVEDGTLLGNPSGSACTGTGCLDVGDISGNMKNALQADPSAAGDVGLPVVTKAYIGDLDGKYWRLDLTAAGGIAKNQMADTGQPIFSSSALLFIGSTNVFMFFSTGNDLLPVTSPQGTGTFKLFALQDNYPGFGATLKFSRDLAAVTNASGIANGERTSTAPSVAGDIVFFTTTTESGSAPCTDFTASLYAFTYLGGAAYESSTDANTTFAQNESPIVRTVAGRATAPFIVDQHLYFGATGAGGLKMEAFGDPEDFNNGVGQVGVRVLSWREIR